MTGPRAVHCDYIISVSDLESSKQPAELLLDIALYLFNQTNMRIEYDQGVQIGPAYIEMRYVALMHDGREPE